ncbi:MAG: hypothetical protein C0594_03770 [Marinilabiliales bacterium]|nr:MAG: hypothetical protein C0594_03770 [Marinilabiliales bacterium]
MKRRIAIPVNTDKLSEYFGHCNHYVVYETENGNIISKTKNIPQVQKVEELPGWASSQKLTDVITHRIDKKIIGLFSMHKINIYVGIPIDSPSNLIKKYLEGKLKSDESIINDILENE